VSAGPLLVVVTGMPAAGKTTVARGLATELALPLVTKDDIKERLYEALGTGDVEWSRQLGSAAYSLIFAFCRELLAAGHPLIAEANFFAGRHEGDFLALPPHRLVQIHCYAPLELLTERFAGRSERHEGHLDRERVGELSERLASGLHAPLALGGELVELDTSQPVDVRQLADRLLPLACEEPAATIPTP
jgi:predicted kinase